MAAGRTFERRYRVRFDESGPGGLLPASGLLRYAQDLAWLHSAAEGFERPWYAERGLTWLIRAVELDVVGEVGFGEELEVTTEVLGFRRAWARRRSEFSRADDQRPLAVATIDWVLLSKAGKPVRVPVDIAERFGEPATAAFTPLRVPLDEPPADARRTEFEVRRRELDPLGHVNNAAYLDYLDEQLVAVGEGDEIERLPRRYGLEYVAPATAAAPLRASLWHAGRAWCLRLESDGRVVLRARLEAELADWVGA